MDKSNTNIYNKRFTLWTIKRDLPSLLSFEIYDQKNVVFKEHPHYSYNCWTVTKTFLAFDCQEVNELYGADTR
jgi:hypothetical protein